MFHASHHHRHNQHHHTQHRFLFTSSGPLLLLSGCFVTLMAVFLRAWRPKGKLKNLPGARKGSPSSRSSSSNGYFVQSSKFVEGIVILFSAIKPLQGKRIQKTTSVFAVAKDSFALTKTLPAISVGVIVFFLSCWSGPICSGSSRVGDDLCCKPALNRSLGLQIIP